MSINDIINSGYEYHHSASKRGYVSRKGNGVIEEYKGKFGTGYTHTLPRWDTTRYVTVIYYIKKGVNV